jgi:tricorn protease
MPPTLFATAVLALVQAPGASPVDLPRHPAASPDGSSVVFSWRGDLWKAPAIGGEAVRLTTNRGEDLRARFTPDGTTLVFESTREGSRNLWVMPAGGGEPHQLTFGDAAVSLGGVTQRSDGGMVVMGDSMREGDLYRAPRPYQVPLEGGPLDRVHGAFGSCPVPGPDGRVLFERGGSSWLRRGYRGPDARDLWLFTPNVPTEHAFRRLTQWAGNDGQPAWAPDDQIVYLSDRDGVLNLWRRGLSDPPEAPGVQLTRLPDDITGFDLSRDGRTAFLTAWDRLYRLDLTRADTAPEPLQVTAAADEPDPVEVRKVDKDVTEALMSPDGKTMAFVAYGDVFVRSMDEKAPAVRVTAPPFRERDIAWSSDGTRLYFVSDASGNDDILEALVSRTRGEIRRQSQPATKTETQETPAEPARTDGAAQAEDAPKTEAAAKPEAESKSAPEAGKDEAKPAPAEPVPADPRLDPARWTEAVAFEIRPVARGEASEREPQESPDGKVLSFRRGGDLVLLDRASGQERVFRPGWDQEIEWRWSPDSRWIAFSQDDRDFNRDIWLASADGSTAPVNLTRHPDNDRAPRFSADGKLLAFLSGRVNNEFDVYTLALDPSVEALTKAELETYFKDAGEAAKKRKPLPGPNARKAGKGGKDGEKSSKEGAKSEASSDADKGDKPEKAETRQDAPPAYRLDDAYLRVRRLTRLPGDEAGLEITPAGDRLVFTGNDGGTPAVVSVKWDGTEQKKVAPAGRATQMGLNGDKVVVLASGRVSTSAPAGGEPKAVDFSASTPIDLRAWNDHRFTEAVRVFEENFYDGSMKGLDWPAVRERYRRLALAARTDGEFEWCANRLLGELNASHTGIATRRDEDNPSRRPAGRLGVRTRPVPGGFEVLAVLPEGPAARTQTPLRVGDVITAVNGLASGPRTALEQLLRGRVGEEVVVSVRRIPEGGGTPATIDCLVTPCGASEEADLLYKNTVARAADRVREWSGGRLGYIHIQSMSQPSLEDFERDLCAAAQGRDGLIVDVRNNGGGSTADRVLASLMAQPHAYTVPRGADPSYTRGYPQDRLYIQRWTLPANMLCNEKSFSNAEIISHAFRNLKRGTLVGEQTYGGVISTGGATLVDGTTVRTPFRGWYTPDGRDMENNGAMPDLRVPADPVDESRDLDAQLRAAVDDLVKRLPAPAQPADPG